MARFGSVAVATVLIVEDDAELCGRMRRDLQDRRVSVVAADCAGSARDALRRHAFDVVVLDLTLPDGSGLDVLEGLRRTGSAARVILLGDDTSDDDRARGLELGADDYVAKPVVARDLSERVLAAARHDDPTPGSRLRVGDVEIDFSSRVVQFGGVAAALTAKEFDLLAFLASRPGHVFSRGELLRLIWHSAPDPHLAHTVTAHIRRLRAKIEADPRRPRLLRTVRGAGYRFDPTPDEGDPDRVCGPDTGTLIHAGGRVVWVDRRAAVLLGYAREGELLGVDVITLIAPRSMPAFRDRVLAMASGQVVRTQVISLRRGDGTEVLVEVASSATEWKGRRADRVLLTEATDASSTLRRFVTGVVSEISDVVIVTDMHSHIRSWNHAAERLYGWREDEVLGRHILDILRWTGDHGDRVRAAGSLERTGRWHGEGRQSTRDGSTVRIFASVTLVRDDEGTPIGIVSVNRRVLASYSSAPGEPRAGEEAEIRRAIDNDEFVVHYQPVVALGDKTLLKVEALVRWVHPIYGTVGPHAFIDTAERSGLILEIGRIVFEKAFRQAAEWRRAGVDIELAVNLSARELADPGLVDRIAATLASSGLSPDVLWLEVTETALVEDVEQASTRLHRLADMGIRIAIDDFGTGWASLTYLREFPVHALKIDRVFVDGVADNAHDAAIARSILSLGAELGLLVIAEGIETGAQQKALQALGCTIGQGYLYAKPSPAAEVPVEDARRIGAARAGAESAPGWSRAVDPAAKRHHPAAGGPEHRSELHPAHPDRTSAWAPPSGAGGRRQPDTEVATLRALLHVGSAREAAEVLQLTVHQLGGRVVPAAEAGAEAMAVDLSLGEGPALVAVAPAASPARAILERVLPGLAEDARRAVAMLGLPGAASTDDIPDRLTGLATGRVLDRVLARTHRGVVVIVGLDYLEQVNSTLGRAAGDAVLASFGRTLQDAIALTDVGCHLGGDEFVVVAVDSDLTRALALVGRLRVAAADAAPYPTTFSAGAATMGGSGGSAALLAAGRALHRAKELGRNRTETEPDRNDREPVP